MPQAKNRYLAKKQALADLTLRLGSLASIKLRCWKHSNGGVRVPLDASDWTLIVDGPGSVRQSEMYAANSTLRWASTPHRSLVNLTLVQHPFLQCEFAAVRNPESHAATLTPLRNIFAAKSLPRWFPAPCRVTRRFSGRLVLSAAVREQVVL